MSESSTYRIENGVLVYHVGLMSGAVREIRVDVFAAVNDLAKLDRSTGTDGEKYLHGVAELLATTYGLDERVSLAEADLFGSVLVAACESLKKKHATIVGSLVFTE